MALKPPPASSEAVRNTMLVELKDGDGENVNSLTVKFGS